MEPSVRFGQIAREAEEADSFGGKKVTERDVAGRFDAPASRVTPIVAGQTLYVRAENGDVVAYR